MIRRILQNSVALLVGILMTIALLLLFNARNTQVARTRIFKQATAAQTPIALTLSSGIKAAQLVAREAQEPYFGDAALNGITPDDRGLRRVSAKMVVDNPSILAVGFIQTTSTFNAEGPNALVDRLNVPITLNGPISSVMDFRFLRYSRGAEGKSPFKLDQVNRSPFTHGNIAAALTEAIDSENSMISPAFTLSPEGLITPIRDNDLSSDQPLVSWIFQASYAKSKSRSSPGNGKRRLIGVAAILINLRHHVPPVAVSSVSLHLIGPLNSAELDRMSTSNGFDIDTADPTSFVSSLRAAALGIISAGGRSVNYIIPVGKQGFALNATRSATGTLGIDLLSVVTAFLIGALITAMLIALIQSERRRVTRLSKENILVLQDIEQKSKSLKSSEERFRQLAESTNVIPWTADLEKQNFTYVGPQVAGLTGYPAETWYAKGFWFHHIHPDDRHEILVSGFKGLRPGRYTTREYRIRAANGRILQVRNMMTIAPRKSDADGKLGPILAQGFILDVTDMKRAQVALEDARRQAEQANKTKSEFLANMSHELRTPLNAVIGFSEIMKEQIFGQMDQRYREYAESIHSSGRHLLDLINDVLDLSKIEAGKIELLEEETNVPSMLVSCRTLLHERATSAGLHIKVDADRSLPLIFADSRRLKQIILNLISNSIKFTPPGGSITLMAQLVPGKGFGLSVADTGIGMSPNDIPHALEKFGQIDGELARKHDGTGLGLPIAKSLAELHGGSLDLQSQMNAGTKVTIWIPLNRLISARARNSPAAHAARPSVRRSQS